MTGEAPPHERLARQLVEGRVGGVRGDERGLARAVDLRGRAAPRAVAAAVVPRQAQEVRRQQALELSRRRRRPVAHREQRDIYSGWLRLKGEENRYTICAANNYAWGLFRLGRFEEARSLMRKTIPVALRVLGESDSLKLTMRKIFAMALYEDPAATRGDLREAMTTLEEIERTARRMLGGAHPLVTAIERNLRASQDAFYARGLP